MKKIQFFCDVCQAEFPPDKAYSMINGQHVSFDKELNLHRLPFEGHYCGDCTEEILKSIHAMRSFKLEEAGKKK